MNFDGDIRLISREGKELERFQVANYLDHIAEHVEPWSYLKFPYYKKLGYPDGVYRVGPLGRLNLAEKIDTPLANEELKIFKSLNNGILFETSNQTVRLMFVLGTPKSNPGDYLQVVSALCKLLKDPVNRDALMQATTPEEFIAVVRGVEERALVPTSGGR